jgi:hypothetical protein
MPRFQVDFRAIVGKSEPVWNPDPSVFTMVGDKTVHRLANDAKDCSKPRWKLALSCCFRYKNPSDS